MDALKKSMTAGKSKQGGTKPHTSKTAAKSTASQSKSGSAKGSRSKSDDKKTGTRGRRAA
jgi:hypothetical protein